MNELDSLEVRLTLLSRRLVEIEEILTWQRNTRREYLKNRVVSDRLARELQLCRSYDDPTHTEERRTMARALHGLGWTIPAIAAVLHCGHRTAHRYTRLGLQEPHAKDAKDAKGECKP